MRLDDRISLQQRSPKTSFSERFSFRRSAGAGGLAPVESCLVDQSLRVSPRTEKTELLNQQLSFGAV
jgi:hypothetical protein